jgi:hypothetical protein
LIVACLAVAGCSSSTPSPNQAAAVPPPPNSATAAASRSAGPDPNLLPYPKQSLTEVFRGSTDPQPQAAVAMPHPPSSYTPSGQPYTPAAGQPGAPPPAAAPAQASTNSADYLPYPQQSLMDVFRDKQ